MALPGYRWIITTFARDTVTDGAWRTGVALTTRTLIGALLCWWELRRDGHEWVAIARTGR